MASRAAAAALIGSIALATRRGGGAVPSRALPLVALAGALDVTGNALFVFATGLVPVGVAAALSGLYPVVTMLLARIILRDSMPRLALAAVALAVGGIVLISIG